MENKYKITKNIQKPIKYIEIEKHLTCKGYLILFFDKYSHLTTASPRVNTLANTAYLNLHTLNICIFMIKRLVM